MAFSDVAVPATPTVANSAPPGRTPPNAPTHGLARQEAQSKLHSERKTARRRPHAKAGHSPIGKLPDNIEPAPTLFEAMRQQLGLKVSSEKTAVEVMAIDHVEKPSPN
jgi:uncharacterized protein (TIGR03435 family)